MKLALKIEDRQGRYGRTGRVQLVDATTGDLVENLAALSCSITHEAGGLERVEMTLLLVGPDLWFHPLKSVDAGPPVRRRIAMTDAHEEGNYTFCDGGA